MSAIELAAELAQLNPRQRKRLLASVPADQRATLLHLIEDMRPVATRAPDAFARLIDDLMAKPKTIAWQNDAAVLEQCLAGESGALQRRLHEVFHGGRADLLSEHVTALVRAHLETRQPPSLSEPLRADIRPGTTGAWRWLQRLRRRS